MPYYIYTIKSLIIMPLHIHNNTLRFILLPLIYFIHFITAFRAFKRVKRYEFQSIIGLNYFCALCAILLKKRIGVSKTVYYSGDFYPQPKRGIYHYLIPLFYLIDKWCIKHADIVWYINPLQFKERENRKFIKNPKAIHKILPIAISEDMILEKRELRNPKILTLSFIGVLSESQGIDIVFKAVSRLNKNGKKVFVKIVEAGGYEKFLYKKAKELGIENQVFFYGYVKDEKKVREILKNSSIGVAMYREDPDSFMRYADSGKIKLYLSTGLLVITTRVPYISKKLKLKEAGFVLRYSVEEFYSLLIKLLNNRSIIIKYKRNAIELAKEFECAKLLPEVLEDL